MGDPMEATLSVGARGLDDIRSQVRELEELHRSCSDDAPESHISESDVKECASRFCSRVSEIIAEYDGVVDTGDCDAYLEQLRNELYATEAESAKISEEIELLSNRHAEGSNSLARNLEVLQGFLDFITSQGLVEPKENPSATCQAHETPTDVDGDLKFQTLELESQIEENKKILKSLEDLNLEYERLDAAEQIEDALKGLKVIQFNENCIKLSLQTYIPELDSLAAQQKNDSMTEPSTLNHELLIEITDKTMEIKNVEMFPNDAYIGDIVDDAKTFRQIRSQMPLSSLEWVVGKVEERLIIVTLQKYMVRRASTLRTPLEYIDREQIIIAHLSGGIDAFISPPQGWPLVKSPLKLASIKNCDSHSTGVSFGLRCKVEELANSLDSGTRENLSSFVEGVERLVMEQVRLELHSNDTK